MTDSAGPSSRFRGFSTETPRFFEALAADPCPDAWPADVRVTYAAHVLSPLKALVTDLEARLLDVAPVLALEARVGRSLSWPFGAPTGPDDCPVRRVRAWARGHDPESSPLLYATFSARDIEIGLIAKGGTHDTADRELGERLDALREAGWTVDLGGLRVTRSEPWSAWIGEPGFAAELEDRFRELLPLFERVLAVRSTSARAG